MGDAVKLTLDRADAEVLLRSLERRKERLCDIRQEICPPETAEPYDQEQCAYFEQEDAVVGRVLEALRFALEASVAG
ncbi:MAG TPA: hypothetical protein VEH76_14315 [Methylocystis sp.]|nr:hypothetical protein [Methylocystis sp.]